MNDFDTAIRAVYQKDYDALSSFFDAHGAADVDEDGRSLLMHAVLASDASVEMVEFLIRQSVPVNAFDSEQNWTALHFAARDKCAEIVDVLLRSGANVNATECHGNTPLARALDSLPHDRRTIEILIGAGADASKRNRYGRSPLDVARMMENSELEALLLAK